MWLVKSNVRRQIKENMSVSGHDAYREKLCWAAWSTRTNSSSGSAGTGSCRRGLKRRGKIKVRTLLKRRIGSETRTHFLHRRKYFRPFCAGNTELGKKVVPRFGAFVYIALAYHFCLDLLTAFMQPGDNLLAEPCNFAEGPGLSPGNK